MESPQEKRPLQSAEFTIQDGHNAAARLQRQITDLEKRLENYFQRLDELEKFCEQTQDKFEATQRQIKEEYELIEKQLATKKIDRTTTCKRVNEKIVRRKENDTQSMDKNELDLSRNVVEETVTASTELKEITEQF